MFIGTSDLSLNKTFLQKIDNYTQREVYAKIVSLTWDEYAIAEITGNIVSGSISIDGAAATRRTCSLTIAADENAQFSQVSWGLNTKFAVLIGLKNFVDSSLPEIIWFQQGIYVITSFSSTYNNQGLSVSIQGKDKMCMLDGSIGGALFADHDFGAIDVIHDDGSITKDYTELGDIIKEAVHTYGLEPYENIVITDLEDVAVELLDYKIADRSLFLYDISVDQDFSFYTSQMVFEGQGLATSFINLAPKNPNVDDDAPLNIRFKLYEPFKLNGIYYRLVKVVSYGDTAGYKRTTLTYPGDLIVNAGSPVSQALDAIVKMLGEFEYFYDIYGRFVFQRKKIYHNVSWTGAITNEGEATYYDSINSTQSQYAFNNGFLITSFVNKPSLNNIRNDFAVWGKTSASMPVHLRYAICDKPQEYTSLIDGIRYYSYKSTKKANATDQLVDWRELIYRMALDNSKSQGNIRDLTLALSRADAAEIKRLKFTISASQFTNLNTCYYYDVETSGWKIVNSAELFATLLQNQKMIFSIPTTKNKNLFEHKSFISQIEDWQQTWNTGYDHYYTDLLGFWRLLYDNRPILEIEQDKTLSESEIEFRTKENARWRSNGWWNPDIISFTQTEDKQGVINFIDPGALLFWIDFIGEGTALEKYKTTTIGRRPKVVNDDQIKSIFTRETPEVLFIDPSDPQPQEQNLSYVKLNLTGGLINYFHTSGQGKTAKEVLDNMVYDYTHYQETVTLTSLPVYYLEPNTRITVYDEKSGISGDYLIKSINSSLAHDGTMTINASRVAERIM